jgi:glycosyltransferase involved in cell wall biosynthesis
VPDPAHTVIIPAYNAEGTVEQAIRSVREQSTGSFEVIAVDDGSSDATGELLERLAADDRRLKVIRQPNAGPSAARNAALGRATGTYLTFLDSDDLLMPPYLETMASALAEDSRIGLAHARAWVLDEAAGGGRVRRATWPPPAHVAGSDTGPDEPRDALLALASGNFVGAVQTASRAAVERAGGLDDHLHQAEDYDLWVRIALAGYRIVAVPGTLAVIRNRPGSLSKDELELARGVRAVCGRMLSVYEISEQARAAAAEQLRRAEREIELLTGEAFLRARLRAARLALGRIKRRLLSGRLWYPEPPAEVAAAFPELVGERSTPDLRRGDRSQGPDSGG